MGNAIQVNDVLRMAVTIEEMGAEFYTRAAGITRNERLSKTLYDLAVMEDHHAATFTRLYKDIQGMTEPVSSSKKGGPDKTAYINAMADDFVFDPGDVQPDMLTNKTDSSEILRMAVRKEKDSIVFYNFLDAVIDNVGAKRLIKGVIAEELSHLSTLRRALEMLGSG